MSCFAFFKIFLLFRAECVAYGSSQARGPIRAPAAGQHHSCNIEGSKPHVRPTPQLTAIPDPQPTERGWGLNLHPHGYQSDCFRRITTGTLSCFTLCIFFLSIYLSICLPTYLSIYLFFRTEPMAYGSSQARGRIRAVATGLHHSHGNMGSEPRQQPTPQLMATLGP